MIVTSESGFAAGDMVYLAGYEEATGLELWRTDGTPDGTVQVLDLNLVPVSLLFSSRRGCQSLFVYLRFSSLRRACCLLALSYVAALT